MSFMDKAKDFLDKHDEQVDQALEKIGDEVDKRTGHKHTGMIDITKLAILADVILTIGHDEKDDCPNDKREYRYAEYCKQKRRTFEVI